MIDAANDTIGARIGLLPELPEKPTGWTKKMLMHMNFGSEGGAATYTVHDQSGALMPIGYQYDTRKGALLASRWRGSRA